MLAKKTLLVVGNSVENQTKLAKILLDEYRILPAKNTQEAIKLLSRNAGAIHAILLDLIMPGEEEAAFFQTLRSVETLKNLPTIISADYGSEEQECKALSMGAWDYITKPFNASGLKLRIKNAIARSQLTAVHQLKYMAEFDTLTGLYNKAKFFDKTREMLDSIIGKHFVFIRFDIDRFQLVNSFFGVEEGDRLLKYLANQFKTLLSKYNLCTYGRIEADIFAFCVEYESKDIVRDDLNQVHDIVRNYNLSFDIVPTFGVYYVDDVTLPVNLMLDRATLAAKTRKGSYIETIGEYVPEMSLRITQEQEIVNEMVSALEQGQFEIYIQPKYDLSTNLPAGGEALVRWNHPEKGMISPGIFIPVFEKNGFISRLDFYVWEKVCKLFRKWMDEGIDPHPISVNVSRVNLYNPQMVENICGLMEKYKIPPRLLELELTETAYTDNPLIMSSVVERLREKGFAVLMDDFGSGYSSLSILKDFEVDTLKIDMHFLEDSKILGRGENIIASIVRMAKWLNIPTVAEGVEKAEQIEFLRSISCEYVQGYVFAKPMPVAEFEELAQSNQEKDPPSGETSNLDTLWGAMPQMEVLFSHATQATCLYEVENDRIEIVRANRAFHRLFGLDSIEINYRPIETILPEYKSDVLQAFRKSMDLQGFAECDYQVRKSVDKMLWINLKLQYLNRLGNKHIIFGSLFDVTAQKNMEAELKKYKKVVTEETVESNQIIIVSASDEELSQLQSILAERFSILTAKTAKETLALLQAHHYTVDLILLDDEITQEDEDEIIELKKTCEDIINIPVLKIVQYTDYERHAHMLSLGINDLIIKPFQGEVLMRRVENVLSAKWRLREILKEYESALEQAQVDPLTKVVNRVSAEKKISSTLSLQSEQMHALMMIDLDNLKKVNDTYGHQYGDSMLVQVAAKLKEFFRKGDIVCRMGGDEFCVFLENVSSKEQVLEKGSKLGQQIHLLEVGEERLAPSCSIGIAVTDAEAVTFEDLYRNADLALYESKYRGKNTITLYGYEHQIQLEDIERLLEKDWLLDELEDAIFLIDPTNHALRYVSQAGLQFCQADHYQGSTCYELIYGRSEPCTNCVQHALSDQAFYSWTSQSDSLQKRFSSKDKFIHVHGRKLHLRVLSQEHDQGEEPG